MRKIYGLLITILFCAFGNAQTVVTIDRENGPGPTATGNDASITSIGLSRGAGVTQRNGTAFSTRNWNSSSQATAETNNDYLEWSTSTNANYDIQITELDIKLRRNTDGPSDYQLFYSLDNFATPGIALHAPSTLAVTTDIIVNVNGFTINSGPSGTITFRLYAWNAATNAGWLRVRGQTSWSAFGIAVPGARLIGTVTPISVNSSNSNIVTTPFDPTDNIDYSSYSATSGLTTSNAIKIGEFTIQDGGDSLSDADLLTTILTDLELDVTNSSTIAAMAIFDGTSNISEVTTVTETTVFSGISGLSAPDNGSKTFDLYATFNSLVVDNTQFQTSINVAIADGILGSVFDAIDAGGAQTSIAGDDNRIEVTATQYVFVQDPSDTFQFEVMKPYPTVMAADLNGNQDVDYNITINVLAAGSLDPAFITYTMTNGFATLDTIVFTEKETAATLLVYGGAFAPTTSNTFTVEGPLLTIASQDFDGSTPEWTYTSNTATFDNGWGTDGYYDVIDLANATPLNYNSFSNNIFGENDLNDEGNGTTGYATLTFATLDISSYENIKLTFDWQVVGYNGNNDDVRYRLFYDGVAQPYVVLFDGNGAPTDDQGTVWLSIPDTVNTVGFQLDVRNNGLIGYSGFDNFSLVSTFDGLLYVDNGWTPNPPSDTTGSDNVYIYDGTYIIGSNIEANNFYVSPIATTSISAGQSLTANASIINNGTIEMNSVSTSYSSLISDNVEGEVIYNRHVNTFADSGSTTGQNDFVSAPVTNSNQTFSVIRTANTDIPSGPIGGVFSYLFGPFDNNANTFINYTTADDATIIIPGLGYRTASDTPTGSTFEFVGDVETSSITTPITVGTNSDFNLIGNPFSSYIKLSNFLTDNITQFSPANFGVYGYDGSATDGYTIWNLAYSDANPTALITPGQGFLVAAKAGGGSIAFDIDSRSIGTTEDFILGRVDNTNLAHVQLEMANDIYTYKTDFYFNDNATLGMDAGYDSGIYHDDAPEFAIYSHLVTNNNGLKLGAQSVNYDAINDVIIPLGVNANQGEQLTISILEHNIPEGTEVFLEDTVNNTFTLLNTSDFVFTPNVNLSGTGRFFLRFSSEALSTSENNFETIQIYTTKAPKTLFIKGALQSDTTLEIYDIQGRMILNTSLDSRNNSNQIDLSEYTTGIYVVKLNNGSSQKSQKVIID
ncbi:T9SS type A sorting domain-containing protein [Psychroserpens damuponensis]|uniref:T9SS type A sorting domain-containing protein n=1 Tax=Psychroserpens damuponensis TaxID=943936 RepID=UPI00058B6F50|nr:T9SS type A sorting domain-containing protein [Psychroserpens damuponensis]